MLLVWLLGKLLYAAACDQFSNFLTKSNLNWIEVGQRWWKNSEFSLWLCADRWGLDGSGLCDSPTHSHSPTHPLSPPPPPGLVAPAALRLLYWVPGWPVLFSLLMHLLSLFFYSWNESGGCYTQGRVMDWMLRKPERVDERERWMQGESERKLGVSLLLRAQWKPSRGSRLDNLSEAPRLFSKAAWLLAAVAVAVVVTRPTKPRDKSFRLTLRVSIYPACLWLLPPRSPTIPKVFLSHTHGWSWQKINLLGLYYISVWYLSLTRSI